MKRKPNKNIKEKRKKKKKNITSTILLIIKRLITNEDTSLKLGYLSIEEVFVYINKLAYSQKGT